MRGVTQIAKKVLTGTLLASLILGGIGCGDSTKNNQGTSFTFLGWFIEIDDEIIGVSTTAMPISGQTTGSDTTESSFPATFASPFLLAGLTNNLVGQTIRVERIFHDYFVPGAAVNLPSSSSALPTTLIAASDGDPESPSSLPGNLDPDATDITENADDAIGNIVFAGTPLVPASVREFLVLNRNQFPEPPFILVVTSYVSGVTSAGHRLDSNRVEFEILVEPDVLIAPTAGTGDSGTVVEDSVASEEVFE